MEVYKWKKNFREIIQTWENKEKSDQ